MQKSSTKPSIQQRIKDQELAIRLLESLNRDRDWTGSKPANLDRITKMHGGLAVLYSQEKAARSLSAKDKGFMGPVINLTSASKKVVPSDFQSMLKRVSSPLSFNSDSTKSNSAKGQSYDFMPALVAAHKQVTADEASNRNKLHTRLRADEREIQYNGKKIVIKFPGVALDPDVTKKRIELFAKDNPKGFLRYKALLAQQRAETNPDKRIELGVRSRNLILTGKETVRALETSTDSELSGKIWNGLEKSVDAVNEAINHPGDRARKAIKAGTVPDNAYTKGIAAFSDIYHPMTGFFGSPEDVQKAVGGVTGSIAKHLTNLITTPTDVPRKFIENHMKPGVLRDAVGLISGATGVSHGGQILGLIPGALDVPNWSGTKLITGPKKYFDEGSAFLDHDTLENRLLFGLHVASPVGDLFGSGVDGIVPNGFKQLIIRGSNQALKKVIPEVIESPVPRSVARQISSSVLEPPISISSKSPFTPHERPSLRNQNLQRIQELDRLRGKGVRNSGNRRRGSAEAISNLDLEWAARTGLNHAMRTGDPLFHSIQGISLAKGFTSKRFHEAAFDLARKIHAGEQAPQGAYVTPDLLDEYRQGITSNRTGVLMADPASVNEFYYNPITGARGNVKSGGGPGYANRVLDPERHKQDLAWAVMNSGAAKSVINRAGSGNLVATYKALGSDIVLGSHGFMAIEPEMRAAGMTFKDIKGILSLAEKGRPKALDWRAVHAVDDIRKVFDPRWSTFENRIKLYKLLFDGHRINGVHWRDVTDLLESDYTKGYGPGDLMNILRIGSDNLHPNGAIHGTYDVGIRGRNEGLFPGNVNVREFYRSAYNRGVGNTTRSLQLGGKHEPDARTLERIIPRSKGVRP